MRPPETFLEYFNELFRRYMDRELPTLLEGLPKHIQQHVTQVNRDEQTDVFASLDYTLHQLGLNHLAGNLEKIRDMVLTQTANHINDGKLWLRAIANDSALKSQCTRAYNDIADYSYEGYSYGFEYTSILKLLQKCEAFCQRPKPNLWDDQAEQYRKLLRYQDKLRAADEEAPLVKINLGDFANWPSNVSEKKLVDIDLTEIKSGNSAWATSHQTPPPEQLKNYMLITTRLFATIKYLLDQCSPEQQPECQKILEELKKDDSLKNESITNPIARIQNHQKQMLTILDPNRFDDRDTQGKVARIAYYVFETLTVVPLLIRLGLHLYQMRQAYGKNWLSTNSFNFYGTRTQRTVTECRNAAEEGVRPTLTFQPFVFT